jgi:hypothetical protein
MVERNLWIWVFVMEFNPIFKTILENWNLEQKCYFVSWLSLLKLELDRIAMQGFSSWIILLFSRCCIHHSYYEIFQENKFFVVSSFNPLRDNTVAKLDGKVEQWSLLIFLLLFLVSFIFSLEKRVYREHVFWGPGAL